MLSRDPRQVRRLASVDLSAWLDDLRRSGVVSVTLVLSPSAQASSPPPSVPPAPAASEPSPGVAPSILARAQRALTEDDGDEALFGAVGSRLVKANAPSPLSPEDDDDGD